MKFLKVFVVVVILTMPLASKAQNGDGFGGGVRAGINLADYTSSTGKGRAGFFGGVFGDFTIKRFGLEAGLYYSQQGSFGVVSQGVLDYKSDFEMDYVAIQFLAKYQIFNGFRVYAGPQGSYLVNSTHSYTNPTTLESIREKNNNVNSWDVGIVAGVGYTFSFGLDVAASYSRGFLDLFKDSSKGYTSMFRVTVGWHF